MIIFGEPFELSERSALLLRLMAIDSGKPETEVLEELIQRQAENSRKADPQED